MSRSLPPRAAAALVAIVVVVLGLTVLMALRVGVLGALAGLGVAAAVLAAPLLVVLPRALRRPPARVLRCDCCAPEALHETRLV